MTQKTELELLVEAKAALEICISLSRELGEPTVEARAELSALKDQIRLLKEPLQWGSGRKLP